MRSFRRQIARNERRFAFRFAGDFLAVAALAAIAFAPALRNDFVNFDDNLYVSENRQVLAGSPDDFRSRVSPAS